MPEKKLIYITRHGQTEYNLLKKVQGSGVNSSLNDFGQSQAQAFFDAFKNEGFDKIYASALNRSYESVKRFENEGYSIQRYAELNEISWGEHEGKAPDKQMIANWKKLNESWENGDYSAKINGGESADELASRLWKFVDEQIISDKESSKILICSHGRSIRALLCVLLNLPLSDMLRFEHHNMNLYLLELIDNKARLLKENDVSHLPEHLLHG